MRTIIQVSLLLALLIGSGAAEQPDQAAIDLAAAIRTETIDGDLDAAIQQYAKLAETSDRAIAAEALLRMGGAYEKLGKPEARETYERLLRDFPGQHVIAAQAKLAALTLAAEPTPSSPAMTVREVMRSGARQPGDVAEPTDDPFFAVSGDGQLFFYADWWSGDLMMKNMATGEQRGLYGDGWIGGTNPVFSPDDKRIAFISADYSPMGLGRIDTDSVGGGRRESGYEFKGFYAFLTAHDWNPAGNEILISGQGADRAAILATVNLESKTLRRLVTLDWANPTRAEYSPDGNFIAYDSTKGGDDRKIYLMSADGAQERVLVDSPGEDDQPLWTRDGRFLIFRSDRSGKWDLYALPMQHGQPTGREVLVKSNLGAATTLGGVTTDGQLFYREEVSGRDIAIAERVEETVQTVSVRTLPKFGVTEHRHPALAPDGTRLAYLARAGQQDRMIRITDLEGTIELDIPLDRRFYVNYPPKWSPDGARLALPARDNSLGEPRILVLSTETGAELNAFSPLGDSSPDPDDVRPPFSRLLGWAHDSRGLYVMRAEGDRRSLVVIDVETERVIESTVLPAGLARFSLSPSGEALLMLLAPDRSGTQGRTTRLVLRSLVDGSERLLTEESSSRFGWDFDSRHVLYLKGPWGPDENRLYSLSLDTLEETVLVEDTQDLGFPPAVSPDGKHWAFEQHGGQDARILVLENFLPESTEASASR